MTCRCCGRPTFTQAGPATRIVRWWQVPGVLAKVAEVICWRCHAWADEKSPTFGKLYATR